MKIKYVDDNDDDGWLVVHCCSIHSRVATVTAVSVNAKNKHITALLLLFFVRISNTNKQFKAD